MSIGTGRRKVRTNTMNAYRRPQQYIHHHCQLCHVSLGCAFIVSVCILMLPVLGLAAEHVQIATDHLNPLDQWHFKIFSHAPLVIPSLNNLLPDHGSPEQRNEIEWWLSTIQLEHSSFLPGAKCCFTWPECCCVEEGSRGSGGFTTANEWRCRDKPRTSW